jgi:hypothetical protein
MSLKEYSNQKSREQQAEGESNFKNLLKDPLHGRIEYCRKELPLLEKEHAAANAEAEELLAPINWKFLNGLPRAIEGELIGLRQIANNFPAIKDAIKYFDRLTPADLYKKNGEFDRNAPDAIIARIAPKLDLILGSRAAIQRHVLQIKYQLKVLEERLTYNTWLAKETGRRDTTLEKPPTIEAPPPARKETPVDEGFDE